MQVWQASQDLQPMFAGIDQLVGQNLRRVQSAMQRHRIGPHHFSGSTGYGHGDLGREAYDEVQSSLKTVIAKHTSQKSGKKGHCHCVTMCICDFAPCISPLTRQHPPCQTCNIMSVCMNITTAHGLALFHMSYAQAVDSCCDVQTLCAQQATCMLDLTGSKLSFALPTANLAAHNTYIPAHSKQSSMNQACSVACNACCSADVCSSARCRGFCSLYSFHVRPLTMGKYSELYVAMLYQIVLYQK